MPNASPTAGIAVFRVLECAARARQARHLLMPLSPCGGAVAAVDDHGSPDGGVTRWLRR